jgi:hypothetical protein
MLYYSDEYIPLSQKSPSQPGAQEHVSGAIQAPRFAHGVSQIAENKNINLHIIINETTSPNQ